MNLQHTRMAVVKLLLHDPQCACYDDAHAMCTRDHCSVDIVLVPNVDVQAAALMTATRMLASRADLDASHFLDLPRAMFAWIRANFDLRYPVLSRMTLLSLAVS